LKCGRQLFSICLSYEVEREVHLIRFGQPDAGRWPLLDGSADCDAADAK
jgi:hypothetical protein